MILLSILRYLRARLHAKEAHSIKRELSYREFYATEAAALARLAEIRKAKSSA